MLKFIAASVFVGTFAIGSVAMAQAQNGNGQRQLSWDQLIQACQNPAAFQSQRQPNAIRLTCEDSQFVWEADQSDNLEIDNRRSLVASLSSDKFYVIRAEAAIPSNAFQTACPRLREVQVTYTKSFALTCQEITNFRGSMHDFCRTRVDQDLQGNRSLATRVETGNVYNMCAAPQLVNGKAQPGGGQPSAWQPGGQVQPGSAQPGDKVQPGGGQPSPAPGQGSKRQ